MLDNIFKMGSPKLEVIDLIICMIVATCLGILIASIHSYKNQFYTKRYIVSLIILPVLTQMLILLVNDNLGTGLAVIGAFNLVRFRSAQGHSRDMIDIFWATSVGLSIGTGFIGYAIISSLFIAFFQLLFYSLPFIKGTKYIEKKLELAISNTSNAFEDVDNIISKYVEKKELYEIELLPEEILKITYIVCLKDSVNESNLLNILKNETFKNIPIKLKCQKRKENKIL